MNDLARFQRNHLTLIAGLADPKGLAIKDEIDEDCDNEISHGRRCPNLDTLVEKELAERGLERRSNHQYSLSYRGELEIFSCKIRRMRHVSAVNYLQREVFI